MHTHDICAAQHWCSNGAPRRHNGQLRSLEVFHIDLSAAVTESTACKTFVLDFRTASCSSPSPTRRWVTCNCYYCCRLRRWRRCRISRLDGREKEWKDDSTSCADAIATLHPVRQCTQRRDVNTYAQPSCTLHLCQLLQEGDYSFHSGNKST